MIHEKEIDLSLPYHSLYGLDMRSPFSLKVLAYSLFFDGSDADLKVIWEAFLRFVKWILFPWLHCFDFLVFLFHATRGLDRFLHHKAHSRRWFLKTAHMKSRATKQTSIKVCVWVRTSNKKDGVAITTICKTYLSQN